MIMISLDLLEMSRKYLDNLELQLDNFVIIELIYHNIMELFHKDYEIY